MLSWRLFKDLRSYYRGCRGRDLREFYDLESGLPYFDSVSRILGLHKRRILLSWIEAAPWQGPILDLGSGIGTLARQLARRGHEVAAVDLSPAKVDKGRRLTARHGARRPLPLHHLLGDLRELGGGAGLDQEILRAFGWKAMRPFEVIIAADVLEHVPDPPQATVQRLRRQLSPRGRLFASVPSRLCLNDPGHLWKLLPGEWEEVFREAGFKIQRRKMSRICWYGLPTPLPLAMVYELRRDILESA
ncbi:MAG: methyltransferase domain-containing protein [Planctomycetes bacterium]|nr:methyltransferase domain-containing protein [Planctomycetota bacterium]